ncbi:FtsX-like permease family protein [Microbacterium sp. X-17]|uniref:ABC transporter permease n=1 Tax=Microbacterium sp. X-17 TaxID=3144404 RepID=UPI0031F52501
MYRKYLRRELGGRMRQTIIVAAGLAIAIALVIVVNALSAGVRDAQAQALQSVYGVGTDLTVTGAAATGDGQGGQGQGGQGGPRFQFGSGDGQSSGGTTNLSQSRLLPDIRRGTLDSSVLATVQGVDGVAGASAALSLTNTTFSGQIPDRSQIQQQRQSGGETGQGGPDGAGGSSFHVDSFTVLGIDPSNASVGPMSAVTVAAGRMLDSSDAGKDVAVVDQTYATSQNLTVGGTVDVGGTTMQIVGIVSSSGSSADTASEVYIPLDVAQTLSSSGNVVSTVYVQATSSDAIASVQSAIQAAVPTATVSSEAQLASTVSGSLSSASSLITNLGTWLSIIVLAVAIVLAVLFTISGVTRRTREFGTLKAIGWSNGRVVGQVAGESMAQGLIGGVAGLILGLVAIVVVNIIGPTISAAQAASAGRFGGPGGGGRGAFAGAGQAANAAADIVLHAPITFWVAVAAVGLAILAGLVAGAFGGWRAARLSPAEALRSVA